MTQPKSTIIIPARFAASRFHAKLVQDLCGKSVIQHTWEAASSSDAKLVVIATDHQQIATLAESFGAQVVLTGEHNSGSNRVCEAAELLGLADTDLVVNLQGDEPLFSSKDINRMLLAMHQDRSITMASMMHPITNLVKFHAAGCVKVVVDANQRALFFSRATIPYPRNQINFTPMLHQGIYGFRLHTLKRFVALPQCDLEKIESLEQLRALYNGIAIHMIESKDKAYSGVDTPEDLQDAITTLQQQ